jgi:leucyl aminopeptidase (aminopeptidase T)
MFDTFYPYSDGLRKAAETAAGEVLAVKKGERVLIVTNPEEDVHVISMALYDAAAAAGASPSLVVQPKKTLLDFSEPSVLKALESGPEVLMSISAEKIGKDPKGIKEPYEYDGETFEHIFDLLLDGKKTLRGFWSPSVTKDIFIRTVPIDYTALRRRSGALKDIFDRADSLTVSSGLGTDLTFGVRGREGKVDDGDFTSPGKGGNLPAGEAFVSPELNTASGVIVFDGSIATYEGVIVLDTPMRVDVEAGFATKITGGPEAERFEETLKTSEAKALRMEKDGQLPPGMGKVYARNARNIGELGIGLNPRAEITGNMLVDEKVFRTCHIAIGSNYDDDAPALTHFDGLIRLPTITARFPDGTEELVTEKGDLTCDD